jgi:hypothetical protein
MTRLEKASRITDYEYGRTWGPYRTGLFQVIKVGNTLYAQEDWAQSIVNNGSPQPNTNHAQVWTEIQIGKGQTKSVSFRLKKVSLKSGRMPQQPQQPQFQVTQNFVWLSRNLVR